MKPTKALLLSVIVSFGLIACSQQTNASPQIAPTQMATDRIDQSDVCVFNGLINTGRCKLGQKLILLPEDGFAREEHSLMFAAQYCDMRYSVVANSSGVICIYYPTTDKAQQTSTSAAAAAQAAANAFNDAEKAGH